MRRIVMIGLMAPDYMICLANALSEFCDITLLLSNRNMTEIFESGHISRDWLVQTGILNPNVSIDLIDYPRGKYLRKIAITLKLVRLIRKFDPDIIHYQSGGEPWILFGLPLLKNYPLIATIHDAAHHPGDKPPAIFLEIKNYLLSRWTDQLILHGKQQAEIILSHFNAPPEKVNTIYIGPVNIYQKLACGAIPTEPHTILFFGRIHIYKGLEILLSAMPLIADHVPDIRLIIAGSGDCARLPAMCENHPAWFEVYNRHILAEEVPEIMSRAAIVVLPYIAASQSAVVSVAASFSRPVIATNVGSIPEIVEDGKTGLLVPPGDSYALAQAIIQLLSNPNTCQSMGIAAQNKINSELSWSDAAKKTIDIYEKAIARKV